MSTISGYHSSSPTTDEGARIPTAGKPVLYLLVTLGCFRNEADSDAIRSALGDMGLVETDSVESAGIIVINTCGFIADACAEGIDTILELDRIISDLSPRPPMLLVGCMGQRYGAGLLEQLPEVSGVLGVDWSGSLEKVVTALVGGERLSAVVEPGMASLTRTVDSWGGATMLVRVADGCDRGCRFCAIPSIKGGLVSKSPEDICREIDRLSGGRDREVLLLAQDLTSYGTDLPGDTDLTSLIRSVSELEWVRWLRLLYLQPEGVTGGLIREMTGNPTVCDYFDIPFQHASSAILRGMGRPGSASSYRGLVSSIRRMSPRAAIRTTMMVGYPGETEEDFRQLVRFVEDVRFDWLGAFLFSPEEGTPAAGLPGVVRRDVAVSRYNTLLSIQDSIEESGSDRNVGRELEVVVESPDELEGYDLIGRSYREGPVVDGVIHLRHSAGNDSGEAQAGDFLVAKIVGREGLDLVGEI